jgi:hypothetical protein
MFTDADPLLAKQTTAKQPSQKGLTRYELQSHDFKERKLIFLPQTILNAPGCITFEMQVFL